MFNHISRLAPRAAFLLCVVLLSACVTQADNKARISAEEAEAIAYEAYVLTYPMLQNFKTLYLRTVMQKYPLNKFAHRSKLLDPSFSTIVAPNNDTLYSGVWLDLREEPLIISVPAVPKSRYYSLQFIDLYTHNFAYIGQRATGPDSGSYAVVGPNWSGGVIEGVDKTFKSESDLAFVIGRILTKNEADVPLVTEIQNNLRIQGLSQYLAQGEALVAEPLDIPNFTLAQLQTPDFVKVVNYLLKFTKIHQTERAMFERFAKIGIRAGDDTLYNEFSEDFINAIGLGVKRATADIDEKTLTIGAKFNGWASTFNAFGTREVMAGRYLTRAAAAKFGLYGHSDEENSSYIKEVDDAGEILDTARYRYTLTFAENEFPPARAFWSITMYRMPEVLFYANAIERYSIGDRTQGLAFNDDGSLTIHIQHDKPDASLSNWLPAPNGEFALGLRIYLPEPEVYQQRWSPPRLVKYPLKESQE